MEISLQELSAILGTGTCGLRPVKRIGICTDSRRMKKGMIYWALKGERFDGHDFVEECFKKGGRAAVVSREWAFHHEKLLGALLPVEDTNRALLDLANAYLAKFRIPRIAVTGSNGKTTTKDMIVQVLSRQGHTLGTHGNFNNHVGLPLTVMQLQAKHKYAVLEMGTNHPGEIALLSKTAEPHIALITNIGYSHIEFFKTKENIFKEKLSITSGFPKRGTLILNVDDPFLAKVRESRRYRLITFGMHRGQIRPDALEFDERGCARFRIGRTKYALEVPGVHNVYNALAAIAVGVQMRVPKGEIAKALASFKASASRMQVRRVGPYTVLDDCYNANPSSMKSALQTLAMRASKGRKLAVMGDMLELGEDGPSLHREIGNFAGEMELDGIITFGPLARHIHLGAREKGVRRQNAHHFGSFELLCEHLARTALPEDVFLVKASRSMRLERVITCLENLADRRKQPVTVLDGGEAGE